MEAPSLEAVLVRLKYQRVKPIPGKVKKKGKGLSREISFGFGDRVRERDLIIFTRQLSAMLNAGLPIVDCLEGLADESPNKKLGMALRQVKEDIEAGSTLGGAMRKHPKVFDAFFVSMVAAGEAGGVLNRVLHRLGVFIEKSARLKSKIKGAMIYPIAILSVAAIVTTILLVFVIPVFAQTFANVGQALPLPTQFVINLSHYAVASFWYVVGLTTAAVVVFRRFYRTDAGRLSVDRLSLEAPLIGELARKSAVARFAHTLSALLSAGVPILEALEITAHTAGNRAIELAVLATRASISEGRTLADQLSRGKLFPRIACHMVSVGEASGSLDAMLHNIAELYDEEVDNAVANMTAMMEPVMILFLGVVIGGLLAAMYLPIFKIGTVIG